MNIVFVTTELAALNNSAGGLASFTANMAKIFAEKGHHVSIVLSRTKEENIIFENDIDVIPLYVPMKKWIQIDKFSKLVCKFNRKFDKRNEDDIRRTIMNLYKGGQVKKVIQRLHKNEKIDIIHYCNHGAFSRLSKKEIPYVVRISGFGNICKGGANIPDGSINYKDNPLLLQDKLERRAIKKAKYVVTPSYLLSGIVKENFGLDAMVIESPFVLRLQEWDYSVCEKYCLDKKKYIIHYGSLRYAKGTHIVAQLVKQLLCSYPDIHMVLAGNNEDLIDENGNKIKAVEYVKKSAGKFSNRVIYVGRLVREQLYPLIQNAELCLLPSRIENLSNACIEAMAMGKIVVATNGASYEQLIDDYVNGFLCERDNADSFLNTINQALNMSIEEKTRMKEKAVKTVERLNPEKIYERYLEFYEKVIRDW